MIWSGAMEDHNIFQNTNPPSPPPRSLSLPPPRPTSPLFVVNGLSRWSAVIWETATEPQEFAIACLGLLVGPSLSHYLIFRRCVWYVYMPRRHHSTLELPYCHIVIFSGAACEMTTCPGDITRCNSHGQCLSMYNLALLATNNGNSAGYTYGATPNNPKTWDANKVIFYHRNFFLIFSNYFSPDDNDSCEN